MAATKEARRLQEHVAQFEVVVDAAREDYQKRLKEIHRTAVHDREGAKPDSPVPSYQEDAVYTAELKSIDATEAAENAKLERDTEDKIARSRSQYTDWVTSGLESLETEINRLLAKAPSSDALNYIQVLKMRSTLSQGDVDSAANVYGDNLSIMSIIGDIAKDHGLNPPAAKSRFIGSAPGQNDVYAAGEVVELFEKAKASTMRFVSGYTGVQGLANNDGMWATAMLQGKGGSSSWNALEKLTEALGYIEENYTR
jgi:hypothetical protein